MRKITAVLVGAGQRGAGAYASYALKYPDQIQFVAVAEIDPVRRKQFMLEHNIPAEHGYESWELLLAKPKLADAMLVCTQDQMHFIPACKALQGGYHVLLEKPMSPDPLECIILGEIAESYQRVFSICHVLRFTDFFKTIKKLLQQDRIGRLITIQHTENVEYAHYAHSFVRGNWRKSKESSPMILAKSCHDMDILLWLADANCTKIASFGSLTHFLKENAPKGAPKMCLDGCPVQDECPYYAPKIYIERDDWINKVFRTIVSSDSSDEGVLHALKEGPYGRCVYHCDNDVVDHQVVNMEFDNGVTVAFTMSAFTFEGGRSLKLMGSNGQIRADMERNEIEITSFLTGEKELIHLESPQEGHGGGDEGIMEDFVRLVRQDGNAAGLTSAHVSVQSHLMAFAAEKSRLENCVIQMDEFYEILKNTQEE
ncbi:gfo/Idh/MocA family oxidoreductase [Paenibacillus sp. LMG 31460]|uniref:Gfo/Idh/MocA family oxidoreductase n=1 Tax=Paenibacillus germinis TaxID=2654979 RepID=A0ABX1Z5A3_9BACL|nr:Gfo/Idh/MocA family oxidoreductase [Paenibacillus germinis]NOU88560.1 gfo/Idh/MocA family oxidoreductase [Paenibacillus germinis]